MYHVVFSDVMWRNTVVTYFKVLAKSISYGAREKPCGTTVMVSGLRLRNSVWFQAFVLDYESNLNIVIVERTVHRHTGNIHCIYKL